MLLIKGQRILFHSENLSKSPGIYHDIRNDQEDEGDAGSDRLDEGMGSLAACRA
jgi:hypothetical protein